MNLYALAGEMLAAQAPTAPVTPAAGANSTLTVNVLAVLALSALTWYNAKHKKASWAHLVVAVLLGVALGSGTAIGASCQQIINSGAAALSGIVGSV
ncbi:hypothetical protein [Embleya sp. NPDC005971]|uniref:hypothetical protein n=1 Tax=Embleya sp. NPDC005971 TaxID=3156724 RepID=UPI0033F84AE8